MGLFHTHSGRGCNDYVNCSENINGSNCSTCGDLVCDTPADPCLSGNVNTSCEYVGDPSFNPDVHNIMSYSPPDCLNRLTTGQTERIHFTILNNSIFATRSRKPFISGPPVVCFSGTTFTINNLPPGATVTWTPSANLTRVSEQGSNPCTFRAASTSTAGTGTILATLNTGCGNVTLPTRAVWAGPPNPNGLDITNSNYGQDILVAGENNVLWVDAGYSQSEAEITDYDWDFSSGWGHWETEEGEMVSIVWVPPFSSGYETIFVRGENACGEGNWHYETFDVVQNYYYSIYPNPASEYIELSIEAENEVQDKASKIGIEKVKGQDVFGVYVVEIWSEKGDRLKTFTSKEKHLQLSTRDLLPGRYVIHLIANGKVYKQHLVIDK